MEHARAGLPRGSLRAHRQWQGGDGAPEFALHRRRQGRADDGRQVADPERSGRGVLPRHRDPLDSGDAEAIRAVLQGLGRARIHYFAGSSGFLNKMPPFTTTATLCSSEMSWSGSPLTAMMSPNLSGSIEPIFEAQPMNDAASSVADWIACMGVMPRFTMIGNWRALSPCGNTPASVANTMGTPAFTAFVNAWRCISVVSVFMRRNSSGHPAARPSVSM